MKKKYKTREGNSGLPENPDLGKKKKQGVTHLLYLQRLQWLVQYYNTELICFVRLHASGTSVWQERKVYANYTRCPDEIQGVCKIFDIL